MNRSNSDMLSLILAYIGRQKHRGPIMDNIADLDMESDELCSLPPPSNEVDGIKNRPDLDAFVKDKGWAQADISRVIQDAGFASSAAYLADESNTVQGLAELLNAKLNW